MSAWRVILCGDKLGGPCFVLLFKKGISWLAEVMKVMGKSFWRGTKGNLVRTWS